MVVARHKEIVKKARLAEGTPDIHTGAVTTDMFSTTPVASSKEKGHGNHFWIPAPGTPVRVLWASSNGKDTYGGIRGDWHPATTTTYEWTQDQGMPGMYVRYDEDGSEDWNAMSLFGDTILPIREPKKRGNLHYTESFDETAVSWLGYGSRVQVKAVKAWHEGQVVGEEGDKVLIKYYSGTKRESVGAYDDLHKRGCKVRESRRPVNVDDLYGRNPWMQCPFRGEDSSCLCWRCRTEKWPRLYKEWSLSDELTEEAEKVTPKDREAWVKFHGHLLAGLAHEPEVDMSTDERGNGDGEAGGGEDPPSGDKDAEGEDADQAATCEQGSAVEQVGSSDWEAASGHSLGMRSSADCDWSAREQRHEQPGEDGVDDAPAKRKVSDGTRQSRQRTQARNGGVSEGVADGKRRALSPRCTRPANGQVEPAEGCEEEDCADERRSEINTGGHI